MLDAEDLDVVSVCTPSMLHREHVEDASRIARPDVIWCEKPIACSVADAESMVETCDAAGVELVVTEDGTFVTFDGTAPRGTSGVHARFNGSDGRLLSDVDGWRYWTRNGDGRGSTAERGPPTDGYADDHEHSFRNAASHIVDLIEGETENVSPGWQACHTLEILVGFFISHATGGCRFRSRSRSRT